MLPRPQSHSAALGPGCTGPSLANPTPLGLEPRPVRHASQAPACGAEAFVVDPVALANGQPRKHTQCVLAGSASWRAAKRFGRRLLPPANELSPRAPVTIALLLLHPGTLT